MAVYAYPGEHYAYWRGELPDMPLPWGMFGENLTTAGLLEETLVVVTADHGELFAEHACALPAIGRVLLKTPKQNLFQLLWDLQLGSLGRRQRDRPDVIYDGL